MSRPIKINEEIDALIEWNRKYPMTRLDQPYNDWYSGENCDQNDYNPERFEELRKHYTYIRERKSKGNLTKEQIIKCKEGNIRGTFGYPESTKRIALYYNYNIDKIDYLISKYGSIKNYLIQTNLQRDQLGPYELNLNNDDRIEHMLLDLKGSNHRGFIYDRDIILEQLKNIELPGRQKTALMEYYGITGGKPQSVVGIARKMGVSKSSISIYINKALKVLREHYDDFNITTIPDFYDISDEEREKIIDALGNYVFREPGKTYNIDNLNELVNICKTIKENKRIKAQIDDLQNQNEKDSTSIRELEYETSQKTIIMALQGKEITQENKKRLLREAENRISLAKASGISVEELALSRGRYSILKAGGINTLQDFLHKTRRELFELKGIGIKGVNEIIYKLRKYGIELERERLEFVRLPRQNETKGLPLEQLLKKEISQEEIKRLLREKILGTSIKELELSRKSYNILEMAGVNDVQDLLYKSENGELLTIQGLALQEKNGVFAKVKSIEGALNQFEGLKFDDLQEQYTSITQEDEKLEFSEAQEQSETGTEDNEKKTELGSLRDQRDKLLKEQNELQMKKEAANKILATCKRFIGQSLESENPDLDD